MDFQIIDHMGRDTYPNLVWNNLKKKPDSNAFVFVNFCSEREIAGKAIESLLTNEHIDLDILQINGDMDKNEKFVLTQLFTGAARTYVVC